MNKRSPNPYHPDIAVFLIAIPFISAFNFYLTYPNLDFTWYYLMRFGIDTAQGYLAWWVVRALIIYMDKVLPYGHRALTRIVVQVVFTTAVGLFIIAATTELLSWAVTGEPAISKFYFFDLFIISIWFYVINGFYIGVHYFNNLRLREKEMENKKQTLASGFMVKLGKQNLKLEYSDILGFFVEAQYVTACTRDGRKFIVEQSLDKLEETLPHDLFFRTNRQYIIHRQLIKGFKRSDHGKLIAMLEESPVFPAEIAISRLKAPAFKSWFRS